MDNQTIWQIFIAMLWPYVQEWWKDSKLPIFAWIGDKTRGVNLFISPFVALLTTAGFHFSWTANPAGGHNFGLYIPSAILLAKFAAQWAIQHGLYTKMIQDPKTNQAILVELEKIATNGAPK